MRVNKPTGKPKKSVPKKVDWKALEIVHPDAAGIDTTVVLLGDQFAMPGQQGLGCDDRGHFG